MPNELILFYIFIQTNYLNSSYINRYDGYHTFTDMMRLVQSKSRLDYKGDLTKSSVIQLDDSNFERIVKDSSKDVMVYYYTEWCLKCKNLTNVVKKVGDNFKVFTNCCIETSTHCCIHTSAISS